MRVMVISTVIGAFGMVPKELGEKKTGRIGNKDEC